jgi:hypothetical protein
MRQPPAVDIAAVSLEFGRTSILPIRARLRSRPVRADFGLSAHFVDDWRQDLARFRGRRRVGPFRNRREPCAAGPHWLAGTLQASQSSPGQVTFGADKAKGGARPRRDAFESPAARPSTLFWAWRRNDRPRTGLARLETRRSRDENPSCKVPFPCFNQNFNRNKE